MKKYLPAPQVLTDKHPRPANEIPAIELDVRKANHPEARIMGVSLQPVGSLSVKVGEKQFLLPIFFHGLASSGQEKK